ncbi:MAG TPA: L,D-transpeptidase [Gammaproteobacteria bacterium]|jgi:lipoprotein-anchoring transpeptidase ErfK/SrfK|nr:L,D-transpeptidase [Gammaproteobacteria bacterium]
MKRVNLLCGFLFILFISFILSSCASYSSSPEEEEQFHSAANTRGLPTSIEAGERTVLVDPNRHAWGAYDASGRLVNSGLASAGSDWCPDLNRPCHTQAGSFRVTQLGGAECYSTRFPIPTGGAPMPYCMYFNGNQALHGSPNVVAGNISHGCVRMHTSDAEWLRYNFVNVGTKVVVMPY